MNSTHNARPLSRLDVEARARSEFAESEVADVMAVLDQYGRLPHEIDVPRVQMTLLKISKGRKDVLARSVQLAKTDYRDVLGSAGCPAQMSLPPFMADGSNAPEIERARAADMKQYREWLGQT